MPVELFELVVLDGEVFLETLPELLGLDEVADADADAVHLVHVAGADAALRRADLALAARFLGEPVHEAVVRQDDVGAVRDADARDVDAALFHRVHLFERDFGIEDDAVADNVRLAVVEDARGQKAQLELLALDGDGVAGIAAALITHDGIGLFGEVVDDLALALVSPLRTCDYYC